MSERHSSSLVITMATESEKQKILEELDKLSNIDQDDNGTGRRSAMTTLFPVDQMVWREAFRMANNANSPVKELATTISQDPVLVLELLRISNAVFFASTTPVVNAQAAIVRLGSDMSKKTLEKVNERVEYTGEIRYWFEHFRNLCKKTSIVARIVAEAVQRPLADDCQTAGLFMNVGDMLAVASLKETYTELAKDNSIARVRYLLANNHRFDTEHMGVQYLRALGIPEDLVAAVDRKAQVRSQERAMMRPIVFAAAELVTAFESEKWDRVAPGKNLPPKSNLRLLQLPDAQYARVYERVGEFLFASKLKEPLEEEAPQEEPAPAPEPEVAVEPKEEEKKEAKPVQATNPAPKVPEPTPPPTPEPVSPAPISSSNSQKDFSDIDPDDQFSLGGSVNIATPRVTKEEVTFIAPPSLRTKKGNAMVTSITSEIESIDNSEDMIATVLDLLVKTGPFEKSALIVTAKDRGHAIVVAARGPNIGNGQRLSLDDPLSPLAQCFSKVRSFSNRSSKESPFGSKAFALAPVDACHDSPVALYADCGNEKSISFEARRVFRVAVEILNQKLPTVPGGIPVEL
ncbi:MAG: HDOD domain-containing protein [Bdellovibrionales bacterium]|nr:HDOD domain-containing protein [Bdellovibrionales bacterium]